MMTPQKAIHQNKTWAYRDVFFLAGHLKPLWKLGMLCLFINGISSFLSSLLPFSSKILIDFILLKKDLTGIDTVLASFHRENISAFIRPFISSPELLILIILAAGFFIGICRFIQNILDLRLEQKITFYIQTILFEHVLQFPLSCIKEKQVGYLMSRISDDVDQAQSFFSESIILISSNIFYLMFSFTILFMINTKLSILLVCLMPVFVLINLFFSKKIFSISDREQEDQANISKNMQEILSGIEVIKTHSAEKREIKKISETLNKLFHTQLIGEFLSSSSHSLMGGTRFLIILLIVWVSILESRKGIMTVGDVAAFTAYVYYVTSMARSLFVNILMLQPTFASMRRVIELFNIVPEKKEGSIPDKSRKEIIFKDINFSYTESKPVLKSITFTLEQGRISAIIGKSGAGKTTLINLLLKLLTPNTGKIFFNQTEITGINTEWLRKQTSLVSQDIFLFNDTLENNIKYGNPAASMDAIAQSARDAGIHDDIEKLPSGYKTLVGERGTKLSAGQRQRIALARAFLKNPAILILDEPTSALDLETEQEIKMSIKKLAKDRTTIIVTHKESMVDMAHNIFLLEKGEIKEVPNPDKPEV